MIPNARETVNLLDQLRESDRKLSEALLEIAHANKIDAFENPYDEQMAAECSNERPEIADIGELRRRLYVAERHGFVKLAAMWRKQIIDSSTPKTAQHSRTTDAAQEQAETNEGGARPSSAPSSHYIDGDWEEIWPEELFLDGSDDDSGLDPHRR